MEGAIHSLRSVWQPTVCGDLIHAPVALTAQGEEGLLKTRAVSVQKVAERGGMRQMMGGPLEEGRHRVLARPGLAIVEAGVSVGAGLGGCWGGVGCGCLSGYMLVEMAEHLAAEPGITGRLHGCD